MSTEEHVEGNLKPLRLSAGGASEMMHYCKHTVKEACGHLEHCSGPGTSRRSSTREKDACSKSSLIAKMLTDTGMLLGPSLFTNRHRKWLLA